MTTSQPTILIVEDDRALNTALVDTLTREGYSILASVNGQEGLDLAYQYKPDLILLDLFMPIMDGHEFMQKLRADSWGKNARIVVLTNFSMSESDVSKTVIETKPLYFFVKSSTRLAKLTQTINDIFKK